MPHAIFPDFDAHSMGGLDHRHLITHLKPADYMPLIATPTSWKSVYELGSGTLFAYIIQALH
jgi:hypothetical protein